MKTTRHERMTRIIFGLGVMLVGSFSLIEVAIAGYLIGLLLIGIGVYPKSTEYPEDFAKAEEKAPAVGSSKKAARTKSPRKK